MNTSIPWIALVFFGLAAYFALGPTGESIPVPGRAVVDPAELAVGPLRSPLRDPATVLIGGYQQRCGDCHRLFESTPETPANRRQHEEVVLDHGLNDRCFNCHTSRDRDKLALEGSKEVGFDDVVLLCAKCHGPTYRDWQVGIHGKTLGAWDVGRSDYRRLGCTECHDPHRPAFSDMTPLPGPNTLRMGPVEVHEEREDPARQSPLLRWLRVDEDREKAAEAEPELAPESTPDQEENGEE